MNITPRGEPNRGFCGFAGVGPLPNAVFCGLNAILARVGPDINDMEDKNGEQTQPKKVYGNGDFARS